MCIYAVQAFPRNLESDLPPLRRHTDEAWKPGGLSQIRGQFIQQGDGEGAGGGGS